MRNGVTTIVPILYFFFAWMLPNSLVQIILLSTTSKLAAMFCFFCSYFVVAKDTILSYEEDFKYESRY